MTLHLINFNPRLPIGFSLEPNSCKVAVVDKDGFAARRGVKPGWKVLSVNDSSVTAHNVKSALRLLRTPYGVLFWVPSKMTIENKPPLFFRKSDSLICRSRTDAPKSGSPSFRLVREGGSAPRSPSLRKLRSADEKSLPISSDGARRQWGIEANELDELPSINSSNILSLDDRSIPRGLQARNSYDDSPEPTKARTSLPGGKMEPIPQTNHRWSRSSDDSSSALALTANSSILPSISVATVIYRQVTPDSLCTMSTLDFDRDIFWDGQQVLRTDLDGKPLAKDLDFEMKLDEEEILSDIPLKHRKDTKELIEDQFSIQSSESFRAVEIHRGTTVKTSDTDQETSCSEESTSDTENEYGDQQAKYIMGLIREGDPISKKIAASSAMIVPMGWRDNKHDRQDTDLTEEPVNSGFSLNEVVKSNENQCEHLTNAAGLELFEESKSIKLLKGEDEVLNYSKGDTTITNTESLVIFERPSSLGDRSRLPSLEMLPSQPEKSAEMSPSLDFIATHRIKEVTTKSLSRDNPLSRVEKKTDETLSRGSKETSSAELSSEDDSNEEDSNDNSTEENDQFGYIKSLIRGVPMMPKGLTTDKPKKKSAFILVPHEYSANRVE